MTMKRIILDYTLYFGACLLMALGILHLSGCDIPPTTVATDVSVNTTQTQNPPTTTDPTTGTADSNLRMTLEPSSVSMSKGDNVSVKVIITNSAGKEVPTEDLNVSVANANIAVVSEIDGRFITFRGVAAGVTSSIIIANGVSGSLVITVS